MCTRELELLAKKKQAVDFLIIYKSNFSIVLTSRPCDAGAGGYFAIEVTNGRHGYAFDTILMVNGTLTWQRLPQIVAVMEGERCLLDNDICMQSLAVGFFNNNPYLKGLCCLYRDIIVRNPSPVFRKYIIGS